MFFNNLIYFASFCEFNDTMNYNKLLSSEGIFNINFCFFKRITIYNFQGGIIYLIGSSSLTMNLIIFSESISHGIGGCIFFNSTNNIFLNKICVYSCFSLTSNHFALIYTQKNNELNFLSIIFSSPEKISKNHLIENSF